MLYAVCGAALLGLVGYSKISRSNGKERAETRAVVTLTTKKAPAPPILGDDPPNDSLAKAAECFRVARHLAQDHTRPQNSYRAVLKWREGLAILERYRNKPAEYAVEGALADSTERSIDARYQQLERALAIVVRQKNYTAAVGMEQEIMDMVPHQLDPRHQKAVREIAIYQRVRN
jgi:hypothetical protein